MSDAEDKNDEAKAADDEDKVDEADSAEYLINAQQEYLKTFLKTLSREQMRLFYRTKEEEGDEDSSRVHNLADSEYDHFHPHHKTGHSRGSKQRAEHAQAERIRNMQASKIQHDLDTYGTSSTYYGRTNREAVSFRFYNRQTK